MTAPVRDRATFAALRQSRLRVQCGCVTITLVPGVPTDVVRVAYGISRAVGGAVERNRVRRRLRAIVSQLGAPPIPPGAYLIGAGRRAVSLPYRELESMVSTALHDVADLKAPPER